MSFVGVLLTATVTGAVYFVPALHVGNPPMIVPQLGIVASREKPMMALAVVE